MFSSLASFLPAALRDSQKAESFVPDSEEEGEQRPEEPQPPQEVEEPQPKAPQKGKRERERRHPNELFVIVRPPPSKSNHPLNLQVQLVPPHSKGVLPRQSVDFEAGQPSSASLYRSPSNRSQESATTYGSTSSFASTASTATTSTSSTRRAIVPLYNLQAHNVLPNVIVDAGTDAKVAKFQKRGIELVDLALLEPIEVWPDPNAVVMPVAVTAPTLAVPMIGPEASTSTLGRLSVDDMGFAQVNTRAGANAGRVVAAFMAAPAGVTSSRPSTPDGLVGNTAPSSVPSISSGSHGTPQSDYNPRLTTSPEPLQLSAASQPSAGKRNNIFGKIFNKKSAKEPLSPVGGTLTPTPSPSLLSNANWKLLPGRSASPQVLQERAGESPNTSYGQSTPTQQEHNVTPTPHHPNLGSKSTTPTPFDNNKRPSGIRGFLGGSQSTLKTAPQPMSSPLSAAFSTLGIKRRSLAYPGPAAEVNPSFSLNEAEETGDTPPSAGLNPAHVLASVPQSNQAQPQPQLSQPVLSVQPTMCVVPASAIHAITSRSNRRPKSRSPDDDDDSRSVERNDDTTTTGKLSKDKEEKRVKIIRRAYMYVWLARKWTKRRPPLPPQSHHHKLNHHHSFGLGLPSGGTGKGLGIDATWMHLHKDRELGVEETVEVRFEWRRAPPNPSPKKKEAVASGEGAEPGASREALRRKRQSWHGGDMQASEARRKGEEEREREEESRDNYNADRSRKQSASSISSARAAVKRWSMLSHQSMSTGVSEDGDANSGNESDPEDSETPWVCTLKVRRTNLAAAKEASLNSDFTPSLRSKGARGRSNGGDGGDSNEATGKSQGQEVLRIKVGVLSPTPHHPKVVAMLKVPFPLPDVQIERLEVVKRRGLGPSHSGTSPDENGDGYYGLTLTAEEIKDIVCSTGLWLVVRESIGGVGKVQRKGDGWMIRS